MSLCSRMVALVHNGGAEESPSDDIVVAVLTGLSVITSSRFNDCHSVGFVFFNSSNTCRRKNVSL